MKRVYFLFILFFVSLFSSYADVREEADLFNSLANIPARYAVKVTQTNGNISIVALEPIQADIEIVDSNGNTVYTATLTNSTTRVTVNTSSLNSNSYTVLVTSAQ
ncbi:MAG: T9SS type A sorting domain-containing protein [Candidatus Symbiothrix sp.]|jgi:hypothetical protein|nr:T9SS type A sorting domain-containing protein [Candidatus Symbiothrix sp.]